VHLARASLAANECDVAIAAGVQLMLAPTASQAIADLGLLSPDGVCREFDAAANGMVRGEGCSVVVLRRADDADVTATHAVVAGSALTHKGRTEQVGAPSGDAVRRLYAAALDSAGMEAHEVSYYEAHGGGTAIGDAVEMDAAASFYASARKAHAAAAAHPLVVGGHKANFGHLEAAAGVTALIKAILCLQHGSVPPHAELRTLNPLVEQLMQRFNMQLPTSVVPLVATAPSGSVVAAVSALSGAGIFGHVVLRHDVSHRRGTSKIRQQSVRVPTPLPRDLPKSVIAPSTVLPQPALAPAGSRKLRVLALHGAGGNADVMRQILTVAGWTSDALARFVEFVFVDAPHDVPPMPALYQGLQYRAPFRSWGTAVKIVRALVEKHTTSAASDSPGAASLETASSALEEASLRVVTEAAAGCDGILGLSEGSATAMRWLLLDQRRADGLFFINVAGAPAPAACGGTKLAAATPSLHLISPQDQVLSMAQLQDLPHRSARQTTLQGTQGHAVPLLAGATQAAVVDFLKARLLEKIIEATS